MSWLTCSWSTFHRKSLKVTDQPRWQQVFPLWTPYDGDPHWPSKKSLRVALKKWKFQQNGSHSPTKNAGNSSHETERIKNVYPIATKTKRHFYSFLCSANVCSHVSKRMGMDPLVSSSLIQAWALWVRKKMWNRSPKSPRMGEYSKSMIQRTIWQTIVPWTSYNILVFLVILIKWCWILMDFSYQQRPPVG